MKDNFLVYSFVIIAFVAGLVCGGMAASALAPSEKTALLSYVKAFFESMDPAGMLDLGVLLYSSLFSNLKAVFIFWFLGLTIVGFPVIYGFVFARGFVIGFVIGFFAEEAGARGALFALASILPHSIVFVPAYLSLGGIAASFSLFLARGRVWRTTAMGRLVAGYTVLFLLLGLLLVLSSAIETYISPILMRYASSLLK
ncbi:MAG TPA: stage II sporulation protein M [Clostridia bacterium]|nr:stage II sporulation protein M [Clostridia bacterium]